jgi:hypothetical protein
MDATSFFLGVSVGLVLYGGVNVARSTVRSVSQEVRRKLRETKVELDVNLRLKEKPTEIRQLGEGESGRRE